jgi:hypothetical protein
MGSGEYRAEKMGGLDDCIADRAGVVPTQQPFVGRDRACPVRNIGTQ